MTQFFAVVATALALANVVPYVVSILRGRTRPARASYAIWFTVALVSAMSYTFSGAAETSWVSFAFVVTAAAVLLLSVKYGIPGVSVTDVVCLSICAVAVVLWVMTGRSEIAVLLSSAASAIGYVPTVTKLIRHPRTENAPSWLLTLAAGGINVCLAAGSSFIIVIVPLVTVIGAASVLTVIFSQELSDHDHVESGGAGPRQERNHA